MTNDEYFIAGAGLTFFLFSPSIWSIATYFEAKAYYLRECAHKLAIQRGKKIPDFSLSKIFRSKRGDR